MLYGAPSLPPIVDEGWLVANRDRLVLADVRWFMDGRDARASYRAAHLPGAIFVDVDRDLAGPPSRTAGRHPLPDPADFAASMSRLGIADHHLVIAYDQGNGGYAARLVWMLRVTGREAAVLDGGIGTWSGSVDAGEVARPPARFTARSWPAEWLATTAEVEEAAADTATILVDARAAQRYRGEVEPVDPRAGHVPTAVNLPFVDNVDAQGRLRPDDELRASLEAVGVTSADDVIVYCGSGVTACQDLLVMERLGIHGRLYPGSWSQWSGDPDRPIAVGPTPGAWEPATA